MSADDYIRYSVYNDLQPAGEGVEDTGQACVYNSDCHVDKSCINNVCVMAMKVPTYLPETVGSQFPNGNAMIYNGQGLIQNGGVCLSSPDCQSNYCNDWFTCTPKMPDYVVFSANSQIQQIPKTSTAMARCYNNQDCGQYGNCRNFNCE